jgi:WD40 repeat protein/transposase-like protein
MTASSWATAAVRLQGAETHVIGLPSPQCLMAADQVNNAWRVLRLLLSRETPISRAEDGMTVDTKCPQCGSSAVVFTTEPGRQPCTCRDCGYGFEPRYAVTPRRIFISYGHDEHAALAVRLKTDLAERGHEVWFDLERLAPGDDWEAYIEEGLNWTALRPGDGRVLLLMTPHSVRRPDGYCLNELARAISRKLTVIPVMVVWSEPPLAICRTQWLDMRDCVPLSDRSERYEEKFRLLAGAVEEGKLDHAGSHARLLRWLEPLSFEADFAEHLSGFTGRQWVFDAIDKWLADPGAARIFWIAGKPGVGKTALAAWLCYHRREIAAFHFCRYNHKLRSDARRCVLSIAYQLGTQLPDYQARLNGLDLEQVASEPDARTLFSSLVVEPLSANLPDPGRTVVVLIDALDEATRNSKNELAALVAFEFARTPAWLRLIITSRPEPEVIHPLQALTPYEIETSGADNERDLHYYLLRKLAPYSSDGEVPISSLQAIINRSEGVFLYVHWVCEEIVHRRLSLDRANDFPQGLGSIFAQFFDRQFSQSAYETEIRPVLEVVCAAQEPLSGTFLASIFHWDEYQQRKFASLLGSLFVSTAGYLQPFHKSLVDWLTDSGRGGQYFVSVRKGHERLSDAGWQEHERDPGGISSYFLAHLPVHLIHAERWKAVERILTNLIFVEKKTAAGMVFDLAGDFSAAVANLGGIETDRARLRLLEDALRRDIHFINRHPTTIFQCLWNSCWWFDCQQAALRYDPPAEGWEGILPHWERIQPRLSSLLERWRQAKGERDPDFAWVTSLRPPREHLGTALLLLLSGHSAHVWDARYSPDGLRIASASWDGTVRIWNAASGAELLCFRGHEKRDEKYLKSLSWSPDGLLIASIAGVVRVWNSHSGEEFWECAGGANFVSFSPDGRLLACGGAASESTVRVWDWRKDECVACFEGHARYSEVQSVDFSPNGELIASAAGKYHPNRPEGENAVRVWDWAGNRPVAPPLVHRAGVSSVAFSPDGNTVASGSSDGILHIWNWAVGTELCALEDHSDWVSAVAWSGDGSRLVSASADRTIRVWDIGGRRQFSCHRGHDGDVFCASFSPDGRRIVSGSEDGTVRIWDAASRAKLARLRGHTGIIDEVVFSRDGRKIVSTARDSTVRLWDACTGDQLNCLRGHTSFLYCVGISPDGTRLAFLRPGGDAISVWDSNQGAELFALQGLDLESHSLHVNYLEYSPDGERIVAGTRDGLVRLWDSTNGTLIATLSKHDGEVNSVAFSEDTKLIVSGSEDETVRIWDAATGAELSCLSCSDAKRPSRSQQAVRVAFAKDGSRILAQSYDGTMRIWDAASKDLVETAPRGHRSWSVETSSPQRQWIAEDTGVETLIRSMESIEPTGWFPATFPYRPIVSDCSGSVFAAANGSHLYILKLKSG